MTERMHDMPLVATADETEALPSADWFMRQGRRLTGARAIIQRIGVFPEDIRSYKDAIAEDDEAELARCNMALAAVKKIRSERWYKRYGVDSDLYNFQVRKAAQALLAERAVAAYSRAQPGVSSRG